MPSQARVVWDTASRGMTSARSTLWLPSGWTSPPASATPSGCSTRPGSSSSVPRSRRRAARDGARRRLHRGRQGRVGRTRACRHGIRPRHRGRPRLPRDARGQRARGHRHARELRAVWTGEAEHAVNFCGGLHHAMPGGGQRLLRLQRRRGRHPVAARQRRRAGGLRRRRRAPRRRRGARLLGRPAGADDLGARERPGAVPGHRLARPTSGGPGAEGDAVNVSLPPGTGRRGVAAGVPRGRAARSARLQAARCSSPSTAATRTWRTRWRTSRCRSTRSARPPRRCTAWRTRCARGWVALGGGGYEVVDVVPRGVDASGGHRGARPIETSEPVPQDWRDHVGG